MLETMRKKLHLVSQNGVLFIPRLFSRNSYFSQLHPQYSQSNPPICFIPGLPTSSGTFEVATCQIETTKPTTSRSVEAAHFLVFLCDPRGFRVMLCNNARRTLALLSLYSCLKFEVSVDGGSSQLVSS